MHRLLLGLLPLCVHVRDHLPHRHSGRDRRIGLCRLPHQLQRVLDHDHLHLLRFAQPSLQRHVLFILPIWQLPVQLVRLHGLQHQLRHLLCLGDFLHRLFHHRGQHRVPLQ